MRKPFSFAHLIGYGGKSTPKAAETPSETDDEEETEEETPPGEDPAEGEEGDEEDDEQEPKPEANAPKPKGAKAGPKPKKKAAEQLAEAVTAAKAEGGAEERTRCATIFASEHASGREALAAHFAFNSELSAEEAIKALAASPSGGKGGKTNPLTSAMSHIQQPVIGSGASDTGKKSAGAELIANAEKRGAAGRK